MDTNHPSKYYPKSGGQFDPVSTGQFEPVRGGQFQPARGGQLKPVYALASTNRIFSGCTLHFLKTKIQVGIPVP